jgi:hypothetical protein
VEHLTSQSIGTFSITCVSAESLPALRNVLSSHTFRCYDVDGSSIIDKNSLLAAFSAAFALGRLGEVSGLSSWDALSDLLWQHFMEQEDAHAAVIWLSADRMLRGQLQLLVDAITVFIELTNVLAAGSGDDPSTRILLRWVLIGEGDNFPRLC